MDPGHGKGLSWQRFCADAAPGLQPSLFPEKLPEPPKLIRVDARKAGIGGLSDLDPGSLGLRDVVIVEHAVQEAFASSWFTRLLAESGNEQVQYWHQRTYFEGSTSLNSIVRRIYLASCHRTAVMMMDENIIRRASLTEELQAHLPEVVQPHADLFQQWPASLQPAKLCLIMGGAGGCSTLHTDMLGWTGWNVLLLGRKHWKFFPPAPEVADALGAEVREMGGHANLGFSCTSPVDMYHSVNGSKCPDHGPDPAFAPVHFCPDVDRHPRAAEVQPLLEVVQSPGELIIFPAHYFHQTYHYDPTIAVASQMMNEGCKKRVLNQILDFAAVSSHSAVSRTCLPADFDSLPTVEQMKIVLGVALDRHWPGRGRVYLEQMWGDAASSAAVRKTRARQHVAADAAPAEQPPLGRLALQLACGMLDVAPWESDGLPVSWAMPLAQQTW